MDTKDKIKFPIHYGFPPFVRFFTLFLGFLVIGYAIYTLFQITTETKTILKILPFIIMFFAYDSISRNLFSLNRITITERFLCFSHLAKKNVQINWEDIQKLESYVGKSKQFVIYYKAGDTTQKYLFPMSYRDIIDVINIIKLFAPQIETDEFVASLLYTKVPETEDK